MFTVIQQRKTPLLPPYTHSQQTNHDYLSLYMQCVIPQLHSKINLTVTTETLVYTNKKTRIRFKHLEADYDIN